LLLIFPLTTPKRKNVTSCFSFGERPALCSHGTIVENGIFCLADVGFDAVELDVGDRSGETVELELELLA
jgi:hypothetical protein